MPWATFVCVWWGIKTKVLASPRATIKETVYLQGDSLVTSELLCGPPGDTALLGDGPPPVRLSCTRRGMSSADLAMLLPLPSEDLALPGEPLEVLGTGRLEWPDLGVVDFFIIGALCWSGPSEKKEYW